MRFSLGFVVKTLLVVACVWYVFHGVDVQRLGEVASHISPFGLLFFLVVLVVDFGVMGMRLRFLSRYTLSTAEGMNAGFLGVGLNTVLPAKLGEVAKCVYITRTTSGSLGQTLGMVFWERFSDLNCLLLFSTLAAVASGKVVIAGPLVIITGVLWLGVVLVRLKPSLVPILAKLAYFDKLQRIALDLGSEVAEGVSARRFSRLILLSLVVWILYWGQYAAFLLGAVGLPLTMWQVLAVFVIGAGGMAVPSSPGGLGVFEAAMVLGLTLFGVEKELALATAIVLHLSLALPAVIWAGVVILKSGMSLQELRGAKTVAE